MAYNQNIPQPQDLLSDSQGQLLTNNQSIDTTFAIDHFRYSNTTANLGKHNQVTTPNHTPAGHPITNSSEPRFYAMQDYPAVGVIQYSMPGGNTGAPALVPTPINFLQSPLAGIALAPAATSNILDFAGMTRVMCKATAMIMPNPAAANAPIGASSVVFWDNNRFSFIHSFTGAIQLLFIQNSGSILRISNGAGAPVFAYWTLEFLRIN